MASQLRTSTPLLNQQLRTRPLSVPNAQRPPEEARPPPHNKVPAPIPDPPISSDMLTRLKITFTTSLAFHYLHKYPSIDFSNFCLVPSNRRLTFGCALAAEILKTCVILDPARTCDWLVCAPDTPERKCDARLSRLSIRHRPEATFNDELADDE